MQAYQITSPIRLLKYVIVFPNSCTKLANPHFISSLTGIYEIATGHFGGLL
jgi:hypothetical protein